MNLKLGYLSLFGFIADYEFKGYHIENENTRYSEYCRTSGCPNCPGSDTFTKFDGHIYRNLLHSST
jgi:hypothetical protein